MATLRSIGRGLLSMAPWLSLLKRPRPAIRDDKRVSTRGESVSIRVNIKGDVNGVVAMNELGQNSAKPSEIYK